MYASHNGVVVHVIVHGTMALSPPLLSQRLGQSPWCVASTPGGRLLMRLLSFGATLWAGVSLLQPAFPFLVWDHPRVAELAGALELPKSAQPADIRSLLGTRCPREILYCPRFTDCWFLH